MRRITPQDFKLKSIDDGRYKYFECVMANGFELVIEYTEGGLVASVFDERGILAAPKRNISWIGKDAHATFRTAVEQANQLYQQALSAGHSQLGDSHYDEKKGVLTLP